MASKDLKTVLKEAREAIKNKSYSFAITKCNKIIKADPENYMALLLLGAAYQETDKKEAAKHLKKAEKVSKEPPIVALQGLLNCIDEKEMPEVLGKLLQLVPEKYPDYHAKLLNLSGMLADIGKILKIFELEAANENADRKTSAFYALMKIYMMENSPEAFNELFERTLDFCLQDEKVEPSYKHDLFKKYLKLLHSLRMLKKLLEKADEMSKKYPNDIFPLEWMCKVYAENHENNELFDDILYQKMELALTMNPNSTLILVANGIKLFYDQNYLQARDMLLKVNSFQPNWNICLNVLVKIQMKLRAYILAEGIFRQLKNTENEDFIICLVKQNKTEKTDEARKIAENVPQFAVIIKESNYLVDDLQNLPENAENLLQISQIHFKMADYEKSLISCLKSVKLEPYNSECFFWLGKIYLQTNDELRAKKCLEKCLNLYPCKEEALVLLSTIYRKNVEWESNLKMLENSAKSLFGQNSSNLAWTHLQLGLHHLAVQNYDEAISAFRSVIRYDVHNITSWEGLADAYMARGSYSSALKVFEKISEFEPQNPYPKLQMGSIKIILHQYTDAITLFDQLLGEFPDYFPILKGIAEAHFLSCQWRLSQRLIGRAREHAQKAVDYLTEAIKVKPNFQCLWKLLANSLTTVAKLPQNKCFLVVKGDLVANAERKFVKLEGDGLFDLALKCYHRMIKLNKTESGTDNHFYWYESSLAYYSRAKIYYKTNDQIEKRKEFLKMAFESAKYTVKLSSSRWHNWNLLGVIAAELKKFGLAQHCFIKAIELDRKTTAVCWSNLGVLYLINGQATLANKAFSRSQQSDTTFMNAWIGQAIIAEQIGQGEEAMDLFRHSTQLGYHAESSIGYPHWVCSILEDKDYTKDKKLLYAIEHMNAISVALDSINWHCVDKNKDCSMEALCFLANLSFSQGHFKLAVDALKKAVKSENLSSNKKDKIYCDMGYCLLKCGNPEMAIEAFNQVSEATYNSTVGKALAYFKASQYEDSYAIYETVLNWLASTDLEKSYVLIAMSAMIYAFQGDNDAKTILFQCISLPNPPLEALYSACSLGLLHGGDPQLTQLVINELSKHENDNKNGHHVAYLISQFYLMSGQSKKSLLYLLDQLHKYPNRSKLRKIIAEHLLKMKKITDKQSIFASRIVQSSMVLERKKGTCLDAAKSLALASVAMKQVDRKQQRILAQKSVHIHPVCKEAWSSLIACRQK